jgi:hypothetical protein
MKAVQKFQLAFAVIATTLGLSATAHADCFKDMDQLRDYMKAHHGVSKIDEWKQDEEDGGKEMSIDDAGNALQLTITENNGYWAGGKIEICTTDTAGKFDVHPVGHLSPGPRMPAAYRGAISDPKTSISITVKGRDVIDVRVARGLAKHFEFKAN